MYTVCLGPDRVDGIVVHVLQAPYVGFVMGYALFNSPKHHSALVTL